MKTLLFILFILPCTLLYAAKSVVIDTDASTDDAIAILYLLNQKDINIKAIIVDKNGASNPDTAASHIAYVLQLANKTNIPVYHGLDKKPKYGNTYPPKARSLMDNSFPQNAKLQNAITRSQLIDLIKQQKVTLLSLGSLTNIADILPEVKQNINNIVIMGGAIDVSGNIDVFIPNTKNKYAEWNIFVDPDAFATVLRSDISMILVSLDVTNNAILTDKFLLHLKQLSNSPNAAFIYDLLMPSKQYIDAGEYDFWDPLAAYVLVNNVPTTLKYINVNLKRGEHFGQVYESPHGYPVNVITRINTASLEKALLDACRYQ